MKKLLAFIVTSILVAVAVGVVFAATTSPVQRTATLTKDVLILNSDGSFLWKGDRDDVARAFLEQLDKVGTRVMELEQQLAAAQAQIAALNPKAPVDAAAKPPTLKDKLAAMKLKSKTAAQPQAVQPSDPVKPPVENKK